jgi:hypothetical protein
VQRQYDWCEEELEPAGEMEDPDDFARSLPDRRSENEED